MANKQTGSGGRRRGSGRRTTGATPLSETVTVAISPEVAQRIDATLEAGREATPSATWTRSGFARAAIEEKLKREEGTT